MRNILILFSALFLVFAVPAAQAEERIAVIVNQDAVSTSDVSDRLDLVIASSGLPNNPEIRTKLAPQVINVLVEEQIKIQEARRLGLEITEDDIRQGFDTIAAQNNMEPAQFREMLERGGLKISSMENQIRAQIAWTKVIQKELRPKIRVSERDIDAALDRLDTNAGKNEFLVAEIFLPVEEPSQEGEIRQLAAKLTGEIRSGQAPFSKVAQQFSKAAGANNGGDLGWVQQDQLLKEVAQTIANLPKGQLSDPVRSPGGYHIILMRDIRAISADNKPSRDDIANQIGLQRLDLMQRRHYMDLRAASYIENRAEQQS